jgi:hypothetical protein
MNHRVRRVLTDYVGRTANLWLLVALAQILQSVTSWAAGVPRVPLLGVVLARFIYTALAEKPWGVLRTLPLTAKDRALIHWWGSFGLPLLGVASCMALAALLCFYKGWVSPGPAWLGTCLATVVAVLAAMSACDAVLGYLGAADSRGYVALVWAALAVAALIGLPMKALSASLVVLIAIGGLGSSIIASLPIWHRRAREPSRSGDANPAPDSLVRRLRLKPRGWTILLLQAGRTTALTSAVILVATTVIHRAITPWAQTGLHGAVLWLVVSAIAITTNLAMRRWVEAVRSLRILPVAGHQLALTLYLAMTMPGVLTCLLVSTAHTLTPDLGLNIPWYLLVVFLPAPVTLIRWHSPAENDPHYLPQHWAPALQQAVWPAWAGAFCAPHGFQFMPTLSTWFFLDLAVLAALFSIVGYRAILAGIRSPTRFESHDSELLESV